MEFFLGRNDLDSKPELLFSTNLMASYDSGQGPSRVSLLQGEQLQRKLASAIS